MFREWLGMDAEQVAALEESGALIVRRNITVEDRRTAYRDEDHAEQLGLPEQAQDLGDGAPDLGESLPFSQAWERGPGGEGLRILELSQGPAGAFAGMLLAELGHEVVRVELPERHVGAPTAVLDEAEEAFLHRRKKSIELAGDDLGVASSWRSPVPSMRSSRTSVPARSEGSASPFTACVN